MKTMTVVGQILVIMISLECIAQTITETTQPLTPEAQKGFIDDVIIGTDGKIHVIYQNKLDKKGAEITYEDYVFDSNLKFLEKNTTSVAKEVKPDKEEKG